MKRYFYNLSIRSKLTLLSMSVCIASLLVAAIVFTMRDLNVAEQNLIETHAISADTLASNLTGALIFQNRGEGQEALSALHADSQTIAGWAFTPDRKVFAEYFREGRVEAPEMRELERAGAILQSDRMLICRPIVLNGNKIGMVVIQVSLSALERRWNDDLKTMTMVIAAASIVALVLATVLQRFISHPILDLTRTAQNVSATKDFSLRARQTGSDELGVLVTCFNQMLNEIQLREDELRAHRMQLADQVARRTEELTRVNTELTHAKDRAEAASRAKSSFLANMSHEIRTPMTAIVGYADMMVEPDQTLSDRQDCLQVIRRNAAHLLELINDILDLSKIEADKMTVEKIPVDLPHLVAEIGSLIRPRAAEKGLGFEIKFGDPLPKIIQTDPLRLKQILVNLLGNALKFTSNGKVGIEVTYEPPSGERAARARFMIFDTGIGMSSEQVSRLFQAFSQADDSMTRRFGGTGLGLTISRRLATLLGGDVEVKSTPGIGSVFTLQVECGTLEEAQMMRGISESMLAPAEQRVAEEAVKIQANILFAEDGLDNQRLISMHLRRAGADVTIAPNGKIAVDLASREKFDLILMDMQMPVLDGYAASSKLRETGCTIPIIALTAHAMADDRAKCIAAGCTDYLTKPIDRSKLLRTVANYLSKGKAMTDASNEIKTVNSAARPAAAPLVAQAPVPAPAAQRHTSEFADDPDMKDLIEGYVQRLPVEVAKMQTLLQERQIEALRRVAHQLKGSGGGYGFARLTELAASADASIKAGAQLERIRADIDSLIAYIREIQGYNTSTEALQCHKAS